MNKDDVLYGGTPNIMFKKTQFSPNTPNGLLKIHGLGAPSSSNTPNNLFRHLPGGIKNNHFDCESNFDEVYYDEARSQFRETIKSQSTDIRSAMAELENLNIKLNNKRQELA
jgi:hypothetical protein